MSKWLVRMGLGLVALLVLLIATGWWLLHASLPRLQGQLSLPALSAPVTIQRDRLGMVTIDAANQRDAMRALGYVHGQERFFEMDLMRRSAAGELAALFGPIAVDTDKAHRVHRLRERVDANLDAIAGQQGAVLDAYVAGVNAGVADLHARPWPYLLLRTQPQPWRADDTPLVGYAMYFDLQDAGDKRDLGLWQLRKALPPALYAMLVRDGTAWDAPLQGDARGAAVLPDAATVDLRKLPAPPAKSITALPPRKEPGSNNFAVSGALTADGRAILADDMHLTLRVPDIWFRARLRYADARAAGGRVDVSGFTLPGLPAVVVGSNGHVAWGFTNSYIDTADWARLAPCAAKGQWRQANGCAPLRIYDESIQVAHGDDVHVEVRESDWGPVLDMDRDGAALALRWAAQLPGSLQLDFADLAFARSREDAMRIADGVAIPTQNLMLADSTGHIGWRLLGPIAQRAASCDANDVSTPATCAPWTLSTNNAPVLAQAEPQRLWTANNRVLDGNALQAVGDGGYALGARARQIRDDLLARDRFSEADLLAIQLDDRALFLQRWWRLLHAQDQRAQSPALHALAAATPRWDVRASADAVSYRLIRGWREAVLARIRDGLTAPAQVALGDAFVMPDLPQLEGVAWPLVTQQPSNLLSKRFKTWPALFEDAAADVRDQLASRGPLSRRNWGERNTAHICHPLAMALPGLARSLLCMPADPLPGDRDMPRVAAPDFGASERMVVSPGHEADGIIHMPGGQSDHPLSPYWGAGHEDWVQGRPTPFLPGKAERTLQLIPAAR